MFVGSINKLNKIKNKAYQITLEQDYVKEAKQILSNQSVSEEFKKK